MITIEDLSVCKNGYTLCRVDSLTVEPGERLAVIGDNGSGKTTLLRVIAGLQPASGGRCRVSVPRRHLGFVHQHPYMFRGSVLGNVMYGLKARGHSTRSAKAQALDWLDRFGVAFLADRWAQKLSGGETRRVALARACVLQPRLLLLDEPLAELDPNAASLTVEVLRSLPNTTLLISSPRPLPGDLCDRCVPLARSVNVGRVTADDDRVAATDRRERT